MSVQRTKPLLIMLFALVVFAVSAFIIPTHTASAAPLTVNNHKLRAHDDLQFHPDAPNNGRNGSFELPPINGNDQEVDTSAVDYWQTRGAVGQAAETKMHLIKSVSPNITASNGSQFASVNATTRGVLYQDLNLKAGQPYYVKFRYRGGTASKADEMMFYFRQKGTTPQGFSVSGAAESGWLDYTYLLTPTASDYEIAFETKHVSTSSPIWAGNYLDNVQVLTPSFLDADLSLVPDADDAATGTPSRYRDRYVTYLLEVKNTGETGAKEAVAHIPLVDGLDWTSFCKVTNVKTGGNVLTIRNGNTISFNIGEGGKDPGDGGKIDNKYKSETYQYKIMLRVSGLQTGTSTYLTPGTTVRNQVKVTYNDDISSTRNTGQTLAGPYENYTKSNGLAEFIYRESGVSGFIFRDNNEDGYYKASDRDSIFPTLDAFVRVYDAKTDKLVLTEDNRPVQISMSNVALNGSYTLYGLKPGQYKIYLDEVVGYMTTTMPSPGDATSNKAIGADGMKKSVIENVVLSGTSTDTLFQSNLNFGLKGNLSSRTVLKHYVNMNSNPQGSGSDPDKTTTANGDDLYTLDYGVPTRVESTVTRNGAVIAKVAKPNPTKEDANVTVILKTSPGSFPDIIYPQKGDLDSIIEIETQRTQSGAWEVIWYLNGFEKTNQKFSVVFRPYEAALMEHEMGTTLTVNSMTRSYPYYMRISDGRYNTSISKRIYQSNGYSKGSASRDEEFTYKIDYRVRQETDILYTFYAKVTVPAGQDRNSIELSGLTGGHYTVTELNSNWKYKIGDQYLVQTGSIGPAYEGFAGVNYSYKNDLISDKWLDGNSVVRNKMAQP